MAKFGTNHQMGGLLLTGLALGFGCKPAMLEKDSKAKDVQGALEGRDDAKGDASGQAPIRTCGTGSPAASPADALRSVHDRYPPRLQAEFPLGDKPMVGLVKDQGALNTTCNEAVAGADDIAQDDGESAKWRACFAPSDKDPAKARPVIHILEDTGAIYANGLPLAVWAYGSHWIDQLLPKFAEGMEAGDNKKNVEKLVQLYAGARAEVAKNFAEIIGRKDDKVLAAYVKRFKATDAADLNTKLAFQNFILGEIAEEYYCSSDPERPLLKDDMKTVLDPFMTIALHFESIK